MQGREKSPVDDADYNKYINRVKIRNYIKCLLFYEIKGMKECMLLIEIFVVL